MINHQIIIVMSDLQVSYWFIKLNMICRFIISCLLDNILDPVYMVPDPCGHDIDFGLFTVIFTPTTFTLSSLYQIL